MKWRTQYDYDADAKEREATDILCEDETMTVQGAPDADINALVARFGITDGSQLPTQLGYPIGPEYYGDFSDVPDLRQALENAKLTEELFMTLPAQVRARFENNAFNLWSFVNDPANAEEAVTLGLLSRVAPEASQAPKTGDSGASAPNPDTPK